MPSYYARRDEVVTDHMGNPVSGVKVWLCQQPANSNLTPPSPLQTVYSDAAGTTPLTQPVLTDQDGHCAFYAAPGSYTVVYGGPQIIQFALTDQLINAPIPQAVTDSTATQTITPAPNGIYTAFSLSAIPTPPASLRLFVNGLLVLAYSFEGNQVIFPSAPKLGDVITAVYTV